MVVSNELAKRLLEAAPDPTIIVDDQGKIVYANFQLEAAFGYLADELIGRPVEVLLPERYRAAHAGYRGDFLSHPVPRPMGSGIELYLLHKDGREIPVSVSLGPVCADKGWLISSAIRDISAQKKLESDLREASRAKSRFLAAASHDLRQPVQALSLLNRAARAVSKAPAQCSIVEQQQKALDSMSRLLNSLLDISKLEAGIVQAEIEDCSVQEIFDSLRAEFEAQAQEKDLELIVDHCDCVARSDSRLLAQILENLVSNAIRYTRQGFVRLRCLRRNLFVQIDVLDTGLGIAPDELDDIFEEFHQVERGPERPEGLGLGLSIVKRTAELLGCSVNVRSTIGEGSVFSVLVPKGDAASIAAAAPQGTVAPAMTGGRILIVDDEPAVVDATKMLLEIEGFDVLTAASEREALEAVGRSGQKPDLLITDYHLRGATTGLDVIRSVRDRVRQDLPAILISGDTSDPVPAEALDNASFLTKPVDTEAFLSAIRRRIAK